MTADVPYRILRAVDRDATVTDQPTDLSRNFEPSARKDGDGGAQGNCHVQSIIAVL